MSRGVGPLEEAQSDSDHGLRAKEPSRVLSMDGGRKLCLRARSKARAQPSVKRKECHQMSSRSKFTCYTFAHVCTYLDSKAES